MYYFLYDLNGSIFYTMFLFNVYLKIAFYLGLQNLIFLKLIFLYWEKWANKPTCIISLRSGFIFGLKTPFGLRRVSKRFLLNTRTFILIFDCLKVNSISAVREDELIFSISRNSFIWKLKEYKKYQNTLTWGNKNWEAFAFLHNEVNIILFK